jgi:hypothetical protein
MIASAHAICTTMIMIQFDYYLYGVSVLMVAGIVLAVNAALFFWWALGWHLFGDGGGGKIKITPLLRLFQRGPDED